MAFWPFNRSKAYTDSDITGSIPLVTDLSSVLYPEDNYSNFSKEGYGRSELVNACIRELASGVASARFFLGVEEESGVVEVENSPISYILKRPNPNQNFSFFYREPDHVPPSRWQRVRTEGKGPIQRDLGHLVVAP